MFAADPLLPASGNPSIRNPRRRQRTHSDENGAVLPKAKKRRSVLTGDTFVKPDERDHAANGAVTMNGAAIKDSKLPLSEPKDLPVRAVRKASVRGAKADGSSVLTKNERYVVSQLPALPDRIHANTTDRLHGSFFPDSGYALAVIPGYALVWPYKALTPTPETFIFALPPDAKERSPSFPLVSLVAPSISSAEPGLVVVMPSSGKISYWESITSAAALDLTRQQRRGVEGSVGGMLSGETVVQLVNAEPVGFLLGFSTGRVAAMSVRDNQGRPVVRVQMLRNTTSTGGGLLGGLKNVLAGGGWHKDVVALRAGEKRKREERDVVVITAKGTVQLWNIHRAGQHVLQHEWHAREDLIAAISKADPDLEDQLSDGFEVLDLAMLPREDRPSDDKRIDEFDGRKDLLVLGVCARQASASYVLIEVSIMHESLIVGLVYRVRYYSTPLPQNSNWRPKLLIPRPFQTAFVVFDRAVVVASMAKGADSPNQQLLREAHRFPQAFEDVLDFRPDMDIRIVGCESEDGSASGDISARDTIYRGRPRSAACLLFVKGAGIIRATASLPPAGANVEETTSLTAKSKIEQAICYGIQPNNPLSFACRPEVQYSKDEAEQAALEISAELLNSTSKAVSTVVTPALENQLTQRSAALRELAVYVKATFPAFSRVAKWRLMWDAEKLAAAREIWRRQGHSLQRRNAGSSFNALDELVDMLHPDFRHTPDPRKGEVDKVRFWFTKDIGRMEYIVPWAYNTISQLYNTSGGDEEYARMAELISEAVDISLGALATAFKFRQAHASLYGLENEPLEDGLLTSTAAYAGLPEFWTSTHYVIFTSKMLTDLSLDYPLDIRERPSSKPQPDPDRLRKIINETPAQVNACCQTYIERYRWCSARDDEGWKNEGRSIKKDHDRLRSSQFRKLALLGLVDEAIRLAQKYEDMDMLVEVVCGELEATAARHNQIGISAGERARHLDRLMKLHAQYDGYFALFGERFADSVFGQYICKGTLATMMDENTEWRKFLTPFLRNNPAYAKISWINDVLVEDDLDSAKSTLLDVASVKERDLWSKKVEMSIGKLSLLAVQADHHADSANAERLERTNRELELVSIQEELYQHVAPTVHVAIDERAEIQLVKSEYGSQVTKDKPALSAVLEQGLTTLVAREVIGADRLVDVLTLMDYHYDLDSPSQLAGQEFHVALKVVSIIRIEEPAKAELLERIIWRRCMIRDDWTVINDTQLKDDRAVEQSTGDTALFTNVKAAYKSGLFRGPSPLSPVHPNDVLGAGSTAADLRDLFPEDLRSAIAADMRKEDERLQLYLDRGRLAHWFSGILDAAQRSLQDDMEAEMAVAKRRRTIEKEQMILPAEGRTGPGKAPNLGTDPESGESSGDELSRR